jgi:hypothetical protein
MATRPWITPQEVRDYSERQSVKDRTDAKLEIDIARAEWYVIKYTGNQFDDPEKYLALPEPVRIATLLLAESFAADAASLSAGVGSYKSESFDDYSYTVADTAYKIDNLDLGPLLDEFIDTGAGAGVSVFMRMRKL